jgi:hypothetical protein
MSKAKLGLVVAVALASALTMGCMSPLTGSGHTATVSTSTASGDFTMSGTISYGTAGLNVNLAAIKNPADPSVPLDPSLVTVKGQLTPKGLGTAQSFTLTKISASSSTPVDMVFINDTTGSMGSTTTGIADSISAFATAMTSGGIDARYAMYTYGDAFATKLTSGSEFTVGKGDFVPPSIDTEERPYIGLSDLTSFQSFIAELKAASCLGSGGGDGPENTVGALDYANTKLAFRTGASKVFVVIGDNPSHQNGDGSVSSYPTSFQPRTGAALVADLKSKATVHVIGETSSSTTYYPLKNLSDGTGGAFIDLPSSGVVDLGALKITDWIKAGYTGTSPAISAGDWTLTITSTYTSTSGAVKTATLVIVFTLA